MRTDVNQLHFRNISISVLPYTKSLRTIAVSIFKHSAITWCMFNSKH